MRWTRATWLALAVGLLVANAGGLVLALRWKDTVVTTIASPPGANQVFSLTMYDGRKIVLLRNPYTGKGNRVGGKPATWPGMLRAWSPVIASLTLSALTLLIGPLP